MKFEDFFYQIKSFKFAFQNDKYRCFFLVFVVFLDGLTKRYPIVFPRFSEVLGILAYENSRRTFRRRGQQCCRLPVETTRARGYRAFYEKLE